MREIFDQSNGIRWILHRDETGSPGPGRLVLTSFAGSPADSLVGEDSPSHKSPERNSTAPVPIIHAGDRLIVEEHTASVDACLEAVALGSATTGAALTVRLKIGGRTVRAIAQGTDPSFVRACFGESSMKTGGGWFRLSCLAVVLASTPHLNAGKQKGYQAAETPPELALRAYIGRVRAQQAAEVKTVGSIWSSEGRLVRLGTDAKAARLHDVVSIVVIESLAASTDGQVKNTRTSNASSSVTALFGALKPSNSLQHLVGQNSASRDSLLKAKARQVPVLRRPSVAR